MGSSHPLPSLAVTVLATVVSAAAGRSAAGCALVAATVLTGQLSIGWCNDLLDLQPRPGGRAHRQAAGPGPGAAAAGGDRLRRRGRRLRAAVLRQRLACGVGAPRWRSPGGWAYDLGLKRTLWSWLPYAVSFALLTAFVILGLPGHPAPPPWLLLAGALLGTGAHFLNVVPDVDDDLEAGVRGLPQRIGAARSAAVGAALLAAAVVDGHRRTPGRPPWWALGRASSSRPAARSAAGVVGLPRRASRTPFLLAVVTAAVAVALLVAQAPDLG